jgi:glycerol-3-phosphate acyltransferase PlsY
MEWISVETLLRHVLVFPLAYLLGAFPTGYLLVRAFTGIDVRRVGSGRTGGTNVLRSAGPVPAILTVLIDGLKGGAAVLLARALGGTPLALALAGVAAILGHDYSVFLGWDGGAGTITMIGVALFIHPLVAAAAIVLGAAVLAVWRYASLASISVALVIPVFYGAAAIWGGRPAIYVLYAAIIAAICINELRPNIARLIAGTERKVGHGAQPSAAARE